MTKATEIALLKEFTNSLPKDTYLRPWLEDVIPEVEREIISDFMPTPSVSECRRRAEDEARGIILNAVARAEAILKEAQAECDRKKCQAANSVSRVLEFLRSTSKQLHEI